MNLHEDFSHQTITLQPDYEGEVAAILISSNANTGNRKSVLYIHGYIDYFFHPHVAEQFAANDIDFYALDLRKYGRSLQEHQHPNYCKDVSEYYEEISLALKQIHAKSTSVSLLAHSTGGLIACAYMNEGKEKHLVDQLILNSPFLDFNETKIKQFFTLLAAKTLSMFSNYAKIEGALSDVYPKSIHADFHGEWDFNLKWKPIEGFPTYFKWILAIRNAQNSLSTSTIQVPVLLMHSSSSLKPKKHSEAAFKNDIVLNVDDMKRIGPTLGNDITLVEIEHAQHDIFLSPQSVRENGFVKMFDWINRTNSM